MILRIDTGSPLPVYEQIRTQLATMIRSGAIEPGERLPSIRQLALDLGIAKATVNKAYEHLLRDGLVEAKGIKGTVVKYQRGHQRRNDMKRELQKAADEFVNTALLLDIDLDTVHNVIDVTYQQASKAR